MSEAHSSPNTSDLLILLYTQTDITMFKSLLALALVTIASAKPQYEAYDKATIISEGPWVADETFVVEADTDYRDPKGIAESLPSPTSLLGRLGNWWTWDR